MKKPEIAVPDGIFSASARYKAPVFQRLYVWGREQFESLIEDIANADPDYGQFLGAIVLKDLGRTRGPTSPASYLIIDGQQRLTTIYMIFLVLADIARRHGAKGSCEFICNNYLAETKSPDFANWPKLVPTLQDRHTLWGLLEELAPEVEWDFSADPAEKKPRTNSALMAQWKRIKRHYESELIDGEGKLLKEEFDALLVTLQERLSVICITLEEHDDANGIFGRLNASGTPLELADLVRNEVFSKFSPGESAKAERYYTTSWHPFERTFPRASLNQFFPIYSYITFRGKVTKSGAFPKLQEKWSSEKPSAILSDLQRYSTFYCSLVEYRKNKDLGEELNGQVERFSRMPRATVVWPFLMETLRAAADGAIQEAVAVRSLRIIEAFLVRRALCGIEPTGLHTVFKSLWDRTKAKPKAVLEKIVTRTIQCPDDHELLSILGSEASDSRVMLGYVLEEYERYVTKANKYDPVAATAMTIEHILPQHLSKDWAAHFSESDHKKLNGLIGNLTPLSETQNKSLQDQGWSEKRKRFKGSNFKSTRALASIDDWNAKAIRDRTKVLCDWIVETWPSLESLAKGA